jgi:polyvinyl alcohol dehydrogenase (cytochrome)
MDAVRNAIIGLGAGWLAAFLSTPAVAQMPLPSACEDGVGASFDIGMPQWNGWSPDTTDARFQDAAAAGLSASNVPKLKLKWAFDLGNVGVARAQPVIVAGRVFTPAQNGAGPPARLCGGKRRSHLGYGYHELV